MVLVTPRKIAFAIALMPVPHTFAELDDFAAQTFTPTLATATGTQEFQG